MQIKKKNMNQIHTYCNTLALIFEQYILHSQKHLITTTIKQRYINKNKLKY